GFVGWQRAGLADGFDGGDRPTVDQEIPGAERWDVGMPGEESHGANVFFDQVLGIATRDQREQQDRVDIGNELRRGARKLNDGKRRCPGLERAGDRRYAAIYPVAAADEQRGRTRRRGIGGQLRRVFRRRARRIDEDRQAAAVPKERQRSDHAGAAKAAIRTIASCARGMIAAGVSSLAASNAYVTSASATSRSRAFSRETHPCLSSAANKRSAASRYASGDTASDVVAWGDARCDSTAAASAAGGGGVTAS